jgi:uncharacterized protein YoxC
MGKLVVILIALVLLLSFVMAALPESNQTLLEVCYSNVQKPLYRQINGITGDPSAWCRQRYPLY